MAGRFRAFTWAQEPRCSRHDRPALAACPQGSLSSDMAVPHSDSRRRKAAASVVLALLAASKALMDVATGTAETPPAGPAPGRCVAAGDDADGKSGAGEAADGGAVAASGTPDAEPAAAMACAALS